MIRPGRKQTNWQPHGYQGFGFFIHGLWSGSPPDTRGRSPVRKSRTPGSVRGVSGNGYPYRDVNGGVMNYEIKQEEKRTVAGFHLVGPWEQTVKKGFEQLMMWVDNKNIVPKEWVAVYYDNPDETPAEKLRCDTVVTVPNNFTLPENSEGVILTEISGGQYAVAVARVVGDDFAKPWYQFFNSLLQDSAYEMLPKPCFEVYLNNGAEDGYWDIEMYVAVQPKHH